MRLLPGIFFRLVVRSRAYYLSFRTRQARSGTYATRSPTASANASASGMTGGRVCLQLMPGADGRLGGPLEDGPRAESAAAGRVADQRLAGVPQALEGHRGATGRLAAVLHIGLVGVALAGV